MVPEVIFCPGLRFDHSGSYPVSVHYEAGGINNRMGHRAGAKCFARRLSRVIRLVCPCRLVYPGIESSKTNDGESVP